MEGAKLKWETGFEPAMRARIWGGHSTDGRVACRGAASVVRSEWGGSHKSSQPPGGASPFQASASLHQQASM
jgi:hypothetical protein